MRVIEITMVNVNVGLAAQKADRFALTVLLASASSLLAALC
jgi:hypothetical protein